MEPGLFLHRSVDDDLGIEADALVQNRRIILVVDAPVGVRLRQPVQAQLVADGRQMQHLVLVEGLEIGGLDLAGRRAAADRRHVDQQGARRAGPVLFDEQTVEIDALEDLKLAADARVEDAADPDLVGDASGFLVGQEHLVDVRVVPAEALAEIVRVEVVGVVGLHVDLADAGLAHVFRVGRDGVVGVDPDDVDFLEAQIVGQLQARKGDGAARVDDV